MNPIYSNGIIEIQRQIFKQTGHRTDAHFQDGYGALFVYEGHELTVRNVIFAADLMTLATHGMEGVLL